MAFSKDKYGIDPHHLIPRNPHLERLKGKPLLSYFVDCGTINLDPSKVNLYKLRTMAPEMFRSTHNLYLTIQSGTTKVVDSVTLIEWTNQFCEENRHLSKSYDEYAYIFQFDILNLESARFGFDPTIRQALGGLLNAEYEKFIRSDFYCGQTDNFGKEFMRDCIAGEFAIEVKEQLKERLIVPCDIKIIERKEGVLCMTTNWFYNQYARESCQIFLLHAQVFDYFQKMIGIELSDGSKVDAGMVKVWCNTYIGKLRQSNLRGWEIAKETDVVQLDGEDVLVHLRTDEFNPNVSVYHSTLPRAAEEFVHLLTTKMRPVRGQYDAFRSYIVRTGARMIEVSLLRIPPEDTVLLTRTDGVIVKRKHAQVVEMQMQRITYDCIEMDASQGSSILPGETIGYTRDDLSFTQMKEDKQCVKFVLEKVHRETLVEGCMGGIPTIQAAPSSVKSILDSIEKDITVKADEYMFEFFQTYERKKWMDIIMEDSDVSTPAQFALYVSTHLNIREPGEFDLFSELFTESLIDFVEQYEKVVLTGPPGVGKSYLAKLCAKRIKDKYPEEITISAVPFHMLRKTYEGTFDWCKTYQSLFGTGINAEDAKYDPYHYYNRVDRHYIKDKPAEQQISLLVLDEYQSFSIQTEEMVKIVCNQARYVLICGDDHQQPNIGHTGMCLSGSIARTITNGVTIDMNIEYRNPCPLYIASRSLTRNGYVQQYLSSDICDYYGIDKEEGMCTLRKEIISIAEETKAKGFPDTVIACQNWDIAGMVILQVVRAMLVLGVTSEHTLIHLGRASTCDEKEDDSNVETNLEELFDGKQRIRGRSSSRSNAHKQGVHGVPLLFFPGIIYTVTKTFKTHLSSKDNPLEHVYQTTLLSYVRSEVKIVVYKGENRRKKPNPMRVRYYIFQAADPQTKAPFGPEIVLSCYEAASYLLYPFITQHVSMIGLTLKKVTILQVSSSYNHRQTRELTYVRSYEPLIVKLKQIEEMYGRSSQYVRQCRQLQVALTRVPKGGKTKVLELDTGVIYFSNINLYCMSGLGCNSLCSLYTDYKKVESINYGFKFAIRQRGKLCKEVEEDNVRINEYIPRLLFPIDKLVVSPTLTLEDIVQNWFFDNKRKVRSQTISE